MGLIILQALRSNNQSHAFDKSTLDTETHSTFNHDLITHLNHWVWSLWITDQLPSLSALITMLRRLGARSVALILFCSRSRSLHCLEIEFLFHFAQIDIKIIN